MEKGRGLHHLIFLLLQRSPVPICSMLASDQKRKQENHLNKSALPKQDKKLIKEIPPTTTKRTKEKKKKSEVLICCFASTSYQKNFKAGGIS